MSRKNISTDEIIDAIKDKFGSVEEFAEILKVSRQAIYSRIKHKSRSFFRELESHGIFIVEDNTLKDSQIIYKNKIEGKNKIINNHSNDSVEKINLLQDENTNLKLEVKRLREELYHLKNNREGSNAETLKKQDKGKE